MLMLYTVAYIFYHMKIFLHYGKINDTGFNLFICMMVEIFTVIYNTLSKICNLVLSLTPCCYLHASFLKTISLKNILAGIVEGGKEGKVI